MHAEVYLFSAFSTLDTSTPELIPGSPTFCVSAAVGSPDRCDLLPPGPCTLSPPCRHFPAQ